VITKLEKNPSEKSTRKWPKKVVLTNSKKLDDLFFTWNIKQKHGMNNLKMGLIILAIFLLFLYPIWPFSMKFFIFKLSLYLLIAMIGLSVIRLVLYIVLRVFGTSFWIFPNLNDPVF
jgi:translocation protein SEC62